MTEAILLTYGALKLLAYCTVCWLGLRWVAARQGRVWPAALGLGLLRASMGLGFGVGIFLASASIVAVNPSSASMMVVAYLAVYVPTRWIEWGLIALFLSRGTRSLGGFWLGANGKDRWWRLIGIVVSCSADVPVLLAVGGLPVGRFMC
jgi:hypothetical protein